MELQFHKTAIRCLNRVIRDVSSQELTQEVRLTDGMPDIGRVLSAWGQMVLRGKEWRGDTVTLTGGVMVWVLYAPEDGSEPRCIDAWIPYQLRWEHLDCDRDGTVRVSPTLRFVDARTVTARKFMVRAGASALAEALCSGEVELFNAGELPEDIQVLRRTYPIRLPKEYGEKTFQMDEELTIPGQKPDKLISYTIRPEITDRRVMANKVVFRGNGHLHLIYRCQEGRIRTHDFEIAFSQFSELETSYSPDAHADIWTGTTSLELDLDEQGQLRLKCGLVAQYLVDDRELVELVEDAYSPRRSVGVQTEALQIPAILEEREETVHAAQTLSGYAGEMVDINFLPDHPRQRRNGEQIEMELPGMFQILYRGEDGSLQSTSARWEEKRTLPAADDARVDIRLIADGQPQAISGPDGLELSVPLRLETTATSGGGIPMVTAIETGDLQEPDPGRPSLILCRPGADGLWKLAKRCGSTVEAIEKANGIEGDASSDRMLLVPVS